MTDKDIIKALKCCGNYNDCDKCDFEPKDNKKKTIGCCLETMKNALDLITRQQAEIDGLRADIKRVYAERDAHIFTNNFIKSEAVKEFAERLKEEACDIVLYGEIVTVTTIDRVVKEMVGEDK